MSKGQRFRAQVPVQLNQISNTRRNKSLHRLNVMEMRIRLPRLHVPDLAVRAGLRRVSNGADLYITDLAPRMGRCGTRRDV